MKFSLFTKVCSLSIYYSFEENLNRTMFIGLIGRNVKWRPNESRAIAKQQRRSVRDVRRTAKDKLTNARYLLFSYFRDSVHGTQNLRS
jgi:hypothetical protein